MGKPVPFDDLPGNRAVPADDLPVNQGIRNPVLDRDRASVNRAKAIQYGKARIHEARMASDPYYKTAQESSFAENALAGIGGVLKGLGYTGPRQIMGIDKPGEYEEYSASMGGLGTTGGGKLGTFAGYVLPAAVTAPLTGASVGGASLVSGLESFLDPATSNRERAIKTVIGALIPSGIQLAGKIIKYPAMITDELMIPGGHRRAAGRLIKKVAGDKSEAIVKSLRIAAPDETAGQAAVPAGSAEFAALQNFANAQIPSRYVAINDAQELARKNLLADITPDLNTVIKARGDITGPMRQAELTAANTAGINGRELEAKVADRRRSMVSAMQEQWKASTEAAQAGNRAQNFMPVSGYPRISARYSPNADRAIEYAGAASDMSTIAAQRRAEAGFRKYQLDSIAAHGMTPLKSARIIQGVDSVLGAPGTRASDLVQKSLGYVRDKIAGLTNGKDVIDARDLYTVRKEIGNVVSQFAKESGNWDKRMVSGIQTEIQKSIDDAIEGAGGTGWKSYLAKYGELSRPIDQAKVLGEMSSVLAKPGGGERAAQFMNVLGRGEQALLKKSTGFPRYDSGDLSKVLSGQQMGSVNYISRQLERDMRLNELAKEGAPAMMKFLRLSEKPMTAPGLLNPKITIANAILRRIQGAGGEKANQEIANLMLPENKALLAEVLSRATPKQIVILENALLNATLTAGLLTYLPK